VRGKDILSALYHYILLIHNIYIEKSEFIRETKSLIPTAFQHYLSQKKILRRPKNTKISNPYLETYMRCEKSHAGKFRKIPRHNSEKFRDTISENSETQIRYFSTKTGNQRKRSVKHHADSDTGSDRKFRKLILFLKNTVTGESDRKISKSVSGIPKNSETVFVPTLNDWKTKTVYNMLNQE
jgi:hypothetical protein